MDGLKILIGKRALYENEWLKKKQEVRAIKEIKKRLNESKMQTQEGMVNEGIALDAGLDSEASFDGHTSIEQQDGSSSSGHAADAERTNLGEPSSLFDFEEVMSIPHNNQGPPPVGPPPPINNGPPPVTNCLDSNSGYGFWTSSSYDSTSPKFFEVTQHRKQNGVSDDALRLSLFPYSLTHHVTAWNQDTINAAVGGTFMQKTPEECYEMIENMTVHHNYWDTSATRDETSKTVSSTTTTTESPECETYGGPHSFTECPAVGGYTQEAAYATT
nr:hypothetical protein [Tanacetum cinerariifolium]